MSLERVLQPLIACVGNPVGGNPTQFVMTRVSREAELDWRFFTSQVSPESFETAFRGIQALGMAGAAILPPFQVAVQPLLDSITPGAKTLGVVHVAKWESSQWIGEETLCPAVLRALTHRFSKSVSESEVEQDESFAPQSIGVFGSDRFASALQIALNAFPGDYSVFLIGDPPPAIDVAQNQVASHIANPVATPVANVVGNSGSGPDSTLKRDSTKRDSTKRDLQSGLDSEQDRGEQDLGEESQTPTTNPDSGAANPYLEAPLASVPRLRLDDLSLTERPVRALILEDIDAMIGLSAAARHRIFKDAIWAAHPVAVLLPPPTGWVEATKERSQCIAELKQYALEWIDELEVLTQQSAINFEFWTGYEPELDSIRESLEEYLQW